MEFEQVIKNRRSARTFTNKVISNAELEKILQSACLAPSAKNRQPWKFYVLDELQKEHIATLLFQWEKSNPHERTSVKGTAEQIKNANKMLIIYSDNYHSKFKKEYYKKPDYLSIGCALQNMSLEAVNLGLGSCILCDTLYIEKEINEYLDIKNLEQICGFIIGKPIYDSPPRQKKNFKECILN